MCLYKTLPVAAKNLRPCRWDEPVHLIFAFASMPVVGEKVRPSKLLCESIEPATWIMTGAAMNVQNHRMQLFGTLGLVLLWLVGCDAASSKPDVEVMFDGRPNIAQPQVYFANRVVGNITSRQMGKGSVEMMTIDLAPEFKKHIGRHWVFYVDNGLVRAARIGSAAKPLSEDARLCGFRSKSDLNWFKFKTLLSDRVYKASLRAEMLYRRYVL